ncbi:SH3 domain-containing protein [Leptolyngbya sp. AN02str]|uniref:SH3 domain-containing protein n=1 Tax=Leptolyngbya sp. AN02str TaxID=3423363 RepID=UPI003D312010
MRFDALRFGVTSVAIAAVVSMAAAMPALANTATLVGSSGSRINVRESPSTRARIRHYGLPGDRVNILASTNASDGYTWYSVQFPQSGARGWIRGDLLRLDSAGAPPDSFAPQRISFAPGTSSANVGGRVQGGQVREYILNARAGQSMFTQLTGTSSFLQVLVYAPNGNNVYVGGGNWSGRLPSNGDYRVQVRIVPEEQANASGEYSLTVGIQ